MATHAHVELEPLTAAHAVALYPLLADIGLWRYTDDVPPASLEALRARYARLETRRSPDGSAHWLNFAIVVAARGIVGFVQATVTGGRAEIAYVVGTRFSGCGYATAAVRALLACVRDGYAVTRFDACVDAANVPSVRLLERLAFERADASDSKNVRYERSAHA